MTRGSPGIPARATDELLDAGWGRLDAGQTAGARKLGRRAAAAAPDRAEPHLLLAECALAEGNGAEALAEATRALDLAEESDELAAAVVLKAGVEIDRGQEETARATLRELPPADVALPDAHLALDVADLWLALGDASEARVRFRKVAESSPELGDAWYGLGLVAEALSDEAGKRAAWLEALRRDAAEPVPPVEHLSEAEFAEVAEAALAELPARARELLRNVPVVIADRPSPDDVGTGLDPRLLGLFSGTPYPEGASLGGLGPQLTQILLFRRNLERIVADANELRDEIRTTLIHETGHFFGLDEDELDALGLG